MIGTKLAHYEITSHLGSGGMGDVYQATDSKLGRVVAVKFLPESCAHHADHIARFEREARVLASLNHPNIAAIHGIEEAGGRLFLVMELVPGQTLAERIKDGPIPVEEALRIAAQIAEALEAAHEKGIIHRDLKPANIKIEPNGRVRVLDFGLAKVVEPQAADLSNAATKMTASGPGMFFGTPSYMSPEQAAGKEVDRTSDVWAFGCVVYEMFTGHAVFRGETVGEIFGEVFKTEPDWNRLPANVPESVCRLLRLCLKKDQKLRFRDIRDARLEIADAQSGPQPEDARGTQIRTGRRHRVARVAGFVLVMVLSALMGSRAFRRVPVAPEARLEVNTLPTRNVDSLAISPDGKKIAYSATSGGQSQLWLRSLDSVLAKPLPGTERAYLPFWSPDSRSLGFFADDDLKRMDVDGGSVQTLARTPAPIGGAWSQNGKIIFSSNPGKPILQIPDTGGEPVAVTPFEAGQSSQGVPQFLPDARHFLYFVTGAQNIRGVYIGQLDGLTSRRLFDADVPAVYTSTGHLLFARQGTLMAQQFDVDRLELKGNPFPVVQNLGPVAALSASVAGPIIYRTPLSTDEQKQLVWLDRSGSEIDKVVYPDTAGIGPSLAPDGRRVAVFSYKDGNMDIWSFESKRRAWERITFDSGDDILPTWSPDGSRIVFSSNRKGGLMNLYEKILSASPGSEKPLHDSAQIEFPADWSSDGRFLLYDSRDRTKGGWDIWALALDRGQKPFEVVHTEFNEHSGQFSPDGKWIAYESDRSGTSEIYIQRFPGPGEGVLVSTNGGSQVRWNHNGKELFYLGKDRRLMAVPIRFASNGQIVEPPGTPAGMFATNLNPNNVRQQYMVAQDGQSFIMNSAPEPTGASPIVVILNWKP